MYYLRNRKQTKTLQKKTPNHQSSWSFEAWLIILEQLGLAVLYISQHLFTAEISQHPNTASSSKNSEDLLTTTKSDNSFQLPFQPQGVFWRCFSADWCLQEHYIPAHFTVRGTSLHISPVSTLKQGGYLQYLNKVCRGQTLCHRVNTTARSSPLKSELFCKHKKLPSELLFRSPHFFCALHKPSTRVPIHI